MTKTAVATATKPAQPVTIAKLPDTPNVRTMASQAQATASDQALLRLATILRRVAEQNREYAHAA